MSTGQPIDPRTQSYGSVTTSDAESFALGPSPDGQVESDNTADAQLVQQTKNQIRQLVNEIAQLSQADVSVDDFYEGFLNRVVAAMASFGGAIWILDDDGSLQLQYQVNLPKTRLGESKENETRHRLLLKKLLATGPSLVVPPQAGAPGDDEAGNPSDYLLVLGTFFLEQQVRGIVEIFQRPGAGPTTQRGYQRFLSQMSDLVGEYLKNRRLRHFNERQELWEKLEHFTRDVHRGLDAQSTAFTIANDGRQLIQCDRVSVALMRGSRCRVEVISGLDTLDRRAEEVTRLSELATRVVAARRPLWYGRDTRDLPPQIEEKLQSYVDRSHSTMVAVLPLFPPRPAGEKPQETAPEPIGALIVENLADDRISESIRNRAEAVVTHGSAALTNALEHQSLFLLPLWHALGRSKLVNSVRNWPRTVIIAACVIATLLLLAVLPASFSIAARGKLQPAERREIFALTDGIVTEVLAEHGQRVERDQVLVRLRSDELETEILTLMERQSTTKEQIASKQRALISTKGLNLADENQIAGDLAQLLQVAESLEKQLSLYREKQKNLELRSENRGQVITWQVREQLLQRPVQKGQILLSIANPEGPWELELYVPERHMGHVAKSAANTSLMAAAPAPSTMIPADGKRTVRPVRRTYPADAMKVTFLLSSHPDQEFEGRVVEIHRTAEVRGEEGNTVLVRVAIDRSKLPELHSETSVQARIDCGRRSLGFVLFRDVIETVQSKVMFWL